MIYKQFMKLTLKKQQFKSRLTQSKIDIIYCHHLFSKEMTLIINKK